MLTISRDDVSLSYNPMGPWADMMMGFWKAQADMAAEFLSMSAQSVSPVHARDINLFFPFGYGYTQRIDPDTNWGWVSTAASGDPDLEKEIAQDVASYGRQLGRMMDLLLDIAESSADVDPVKLAEVKEIHTRIEATKSKYGG